MLGFSRKSLSILLLPIFLGWLVFWRHRVTFDPTTIKNQVVVVCGASSGIGEQIAYEYAKLGARLVLAARREDRLQKVKAKCKEVGSPDVHYVVSDFGKKGSTEHLHKETLNYFSHVDVLILNHVSSPSFTLLSNVSNKKADIEEILEVNLISYIKLARLLTPALASSGGHIVVVSSILGFIGVPFAAIYSTSKHALHGFFNSYRSELILEGLQNVSVTICILGPIDTDLAARALKQGLSSKMPLSSRTDCAKAIIANAACKKTSMYFPLYLRYVHWMLFLSSQ